MSSDSSDVITIAATALTPKQMPISSRISIVSRCLYERMAVKNASASRQNSTRYGSGVGPWGANTDDATTATVTMAVSMSSTPHAQVRRGGSRRLPRRAVVSIFWVLTLNPPSASATGS